MFSYLYWREPLALLLSLLPLFLLLIIRLKQKKQWQNIADNHLLEWVKTKQGVGENGFKKALIVMVWVLLTLALAGPRTIHSMPPSSNKQISETIIIVDYSQSMMARDEQPNRLLKAIHWLEQIIKTAPQSMKLGLIVYSGHAHWVVKPTDDMQLFIHFVENLKDLKLPTLGNNLLQAFTMSQSAFTTGIDNKNIILITDGDVEQIVKKQGSSYYYENLKTNNINLTIIGTGYSELVSVPIANNQYLKQNGQRVLTRKDTTWLKQLKASQYFDIDTIAHKKLEKLIKLPQTKLSKKDRQNIIWTEWFFIPLLLSILILLAVTHARIKSSALNVLFSVISINLFISPSADAALWFAEQPEHLLSFNKATACYNDKDYFCAERYFAESAWKAEHPQAKGRAIFNLANTHFKLANYQQAAVLFKDAEKWGIDKKLVKINYAFANSLAKSVKKMLADIEETKRRADWRIDSQEITDMLNDRLAEGRYLPKVKSESKQFSQLSQTQLNNLIMSGLQRQQNASGVVQNSRTKAWVESFQTEQQQTTSGLLNRLFSIEVGVPIVTDKPYSLKGQRQW